STLTGCWPPTHGVRFDLAPEDSLLPRAQTLAHALKEREYRTAFFMDNTTFAWMPPDVGFDEIVQPPPNAVDFAVTYVQPAAILYYYFLNNRLGFHFDPSLRLNAAYRTIYKPQYMEKEISNFLWRMRSETKFFMAVHLVCIHVPFCVSYPYSTYFRPGFGPVLNRFGYRPLLEQIVLKKEAKEEFSDEERWQIYTQEINLYDALTRSSDSSFGAIIDSIRKAGLYDNSYIVFLSDHGENLPEPGLRYLYASSTHGFFMWGDGDTHIPLAIKFPDNRHAGRRVERLVRSIDIAPTLLDSLGLPAMKTDGVSRMPDIEGKSDDRERWTYAETGESAPMFFVADHLAYEFDDYFQAHEIDPPSLRIHKKKKYMPNLIMSKDRMVRTEQWKLISYPIVTSSTLSFRTELFDVIADRNNCEDVSSSHPAVVQELHAKLWPFIEQDLKEFGSGSLRSVERPGRYVSRDRDDPKNPSPNPVHEQVSH
ncbi:sulfatase-like hydrolase/transferase, partial [Candidatus Sumerlaeota bacterium]|nr:sulfatase-like hydrolase/transferase [Candidatus Sumerlaeota bacterium]